MPVSAEPIKWVDFGVPYESLKHAMEIDISTAEKEKHLSWIDILAVAGCRTGGKCPLDAVKKAAEELASDRDMEAVLGDLYRYYPYYRESRLYIHQAFPAQIFFSNSYTSYFSSIIS